MTQRALFDTAPELAYDDDADDVCQLEPDYFAHAMDDDRERYDFDEYRRHVYAVLEDRGPADLPWPAAVELLAAMDAGRPAEDFAANWIANG
jgi:hypothetical protein